jgi:flagellin-like hook-associated protein FlgL
MQRHLQTGRKITQPSDNVGEVGKISKLKYNIKANFARRQNLQNALSFAQAQDGAMKNMGNIIKRAGEISAIFSTCCKIS